jgi:hypothetical protein
MINTHNKQDTDSAFMPKQQQVQVFTQVQDTSPPTSLTILPEAGQPAIVLQLECKRQLIPTCIQREQSSTMPCLRPPTSRRRLSKISSQNASWH